MAQTRSIGLRALLQTAGLGEEKDCHGHRRRFTLAPRLNAAGRLGCARLMVELLTNDRADALPRSLVTSKANEERQKSNAHAGRRASSSPTWTWSRPGRSSGHHNWHAGVIGIVAGKLADQYARRLMISLREDALIGLGSGRSIPGFPCTRLCVRARRPAQSWRHAAAAGFKIHHAEIPSFRERFLRLASLFPRAATATQPVLDGEAPLHVLNLELVGRPGQTRPYGAGNPRPLACRRPRSRHDAATRWDWRTAPMFESVRRDNRCGHCLQPRRTPGGNDVADGWCCLAFRRR